MPRFPVAFSKRKSTAESIENVAVTPPSGSSFRVLDRSEITGSKNFDSSPTLRPPAKSYTMSNAAGSDGAYLDDNLFADLKNNRGSGSSNTTKTTSTDNSSRHSNASTAPSSADMGQQQQQQQYQQQQYQQDEWKPAASKKTYGDVPVPPIPKSSTTSSFLRSAGRTFSFGGQKKHQVMSSAYEERTPETPPKFDSTEYANRERAATSSTVTTTTPPKLDEQDFTLDLGGDFGSMLGSFDKRSSGMTIRDGGDGRPALAPRSLTGNRLNQPTPIQVDNQTKVEASPYSWGSHNSNDRLMNSQSPMTSPTNENAPPPPVPRHTSSYGFGGPESPSGPASSPDSGLKRSSAVLVGRRRSTIDYSAEVEDEDAVLLKDQYSTVNRFLSGSGAPSSLPSKSPPPQGGRFRRDETLGTGAAMASGSGYRQVPTESTSPRFGSKAANDDDDDNLFDTSFAKTTRQEQRYTVAHRAPAPATTNKVMTPAQFERYRKDKEREETSNGVSVVKADASDNDEEDDNYDDDLDEAEKSRLAAKQRRKQEAHMAVYRQQMMKVTGEAATGTPIRSTMQPSMSTPNLPSLAGEGSGTPSPPRAGSEGEDEDEEVPLGILAAHGFPNKNRPPTRLSSMMSNPNLRSAAGPSYQRTSSVMGDGSQANGAANGAANGSGGRLPPFARNLPQDPYVGAGLVNPSVRETLNYGAGQGPQQAPGSVPGGLVGVIATEERSRALRRGSPNVDATNKPIPGMGPGQFDPMAGFSPQMLYPGPPPMLTPGDQAQIQMTQQMQQFMQMQMQFMQMMATNNRPVSHGAMTPNGMPTGMPNGMPNPDMMRHSFADQGPSMDMGVRPDMHMRTMSMVQPSSASWVQPNGYAPSIRVQGANGYAPSIAPSERSNIGLPGRYRPVSHMPAGPNANELRKSMTMSGAIGVNGETTNGSSSPGDGPGTSNPNGWDQSRKQTNRSPLNKATNADDDDDEQGWAAMKAKRDKKRSMWKSKKSTPGSEISTLIS